MKPSDDSAPDDIEIGLVNEAVFPGPPKKTSPQEGIATMEKRLEFLRHELRRYSEAAEQFPEQTEKFAREMAATRRRIDETGARLREYRLQQDGKN